MASLHNYRDMLPNSGNYRNLLNEYKIVNRNFVSKIELTIKTKAGVQHTVREVNSINYEHTVNKPAKLSVELANYKTHMDIQPGDMVIYKRGYRDLAYYPPSEKDRKVTANQLATRFVGFVDSIRENTLLCYDELHFMNMEHAKTPEWVGEEYYKTDDTGNVILIDVNNHNNTTTVAAADLEAFLDQFGGAFAPVIERRPFDIRDIVDEVAAPRPRRVRNWFSGDKVVDFPFDITFFSDKANGGISKRVVLRGVMSSSYHYGIDPRLPDIFYVRPKYRKDGWSLVGVNSIGDITDFEQLERDYKPYQPEGTELVDLLRDYGNPEEIVFDDRVLLSSSLTKPTSEIVGIQFTYKAPNNDPNVETNVQYLYLPPRTDDADAIVERERVLDIVDRVHEMFNRDLYMHEAKALAVREFKERNSKRFSGSFTILGHPIVFAGDRVWYVDRFLDTEMFDPEMLIVTVSEIYDGTIINQTLTAE